LIIAGELQESSKKSVLKIVCPTYLSRGILISRWLNRMLLKKVSPVTFLKADLSTRLRVEIDLFATGRAELTNSRDCRGLAGETG
jgi:hypothetical protein